MADPSLYWNMDDPDAPWGLFDDDAELPIPINLVEWLASEEATYVSHEVIADPMFEVIASPHSEGVITVYLKIADDQTPVSGTKYSFTIRYSASAGGFELKDDRTLWLKIKPR